MEDATVVIVLGQSLNPDGSAPATLMSRVKRAATVWLENPNVTLVLSGGDPANTGKSEAQVMKDLLVSKNIPVESIVLEETSANTLQNAHFSLPIIKRLGCREIGILSSDFHLPRAVYLFQAYFSFFCEDLKIHSIPAITESPYKHDTGINSNFLLDRLTMEKRFLSTLVVQHHLPKHIPNLPIPPLSESELQKAVDKIDEMIRSVK